MSNSNSVWVIYRPDPWADTKAIIYGSIIAIWTDKQAARKNLDQLNEDWASGFTTMDGRRLRPYKYRRVALGMMLDHAPHPDRNHPYLLHEDMGEDR